MNLDEQRPNAALINREWYESAKNVLGARDLSCVLVAAVEYVLYGDAGITLNDTARIVFAMVRPALDSDVTKYRERCARNAANAKSKRVAPSGSEWHPVAASGEQLQLQHQLQPQLQLQHQSLSPEEMERKEKFMVYGYFWSVGSANPTEESRQFWSYYEALGWRNNKGAAIVSKLAAARMWRRQFESTEPKGLAAQWFAAFKDCPVIDYNVFDAFAGGEIQSDPERAVVVRLRAPQAYLDSIQDRAGECLQALCRACKGSCVRLEPVG